MTAFDAQLAHCRHCGARFSPLPGEADFCCNGCRYVHDLIAAEGLDQFYALKEDRSIGAVGTTVFQPVDWDWTARLQAEAETARPAAPEVELHLGGMSCAACAWLIERRFARRPGALRIGIYPDEGRLRLSWEPGRFSLPEFSADLLQFGYRVSEREETAARTGDGLTARLGLCAAFAMNTMAFTLPHYLGLAAGSDLGMLCQLIALASASLSVLAGGGYFFRRAWQALRDRSLHMDLPIALGIGAAFGGSIVAWIFRMPSLFYVDFVVTFVFLMLLGRWIQERALAASRNRRSEGRVISEAFRNLQAGDRFEVKPGEVVPVEAVLLGAPSEFSLEWITGEPDPVEGREGQSIPAGARLLASQPASLQARERFEGSLLSELMTPREPAGDDLLQRVLGIYLVVVLAAALLGGAWWTWRESFGAGLQVFISVLVVSCPCALGVAIPRINARAARILEREGLFVRHLSLWNRLRRVRRLAFDKTGTLTLPTPRLRNPEALEALPPEALGRLWQLVAGNRHPLARGLHEMLPRAEVSDEFDVMPGGIGEEPGCGVSLTDSQGRMWSLGRPGWKAGGEATADLVFGDSGNLLAGFSFEEALRPGAADEIAWLRRRFDSVVILSGDKPERVEQVARVIGLCPGDAQGRLTPHGKADWLRAHQPEQTLFLGDGANDSLAFDIALCSGTPANGNVMVESKADFFFLGKGLRAVRRLLEIAGTRRQVVRQVFGFAVLYNLGAAVLCLGGLMNPLLAAVLMPASSLVVLGLTQTGWREDE